MKETIQQKKVAYKKICKSRLEENKVKYKNIKNSTKKMVANSMRKEAEKELTKLNQITFYNGEVHEKRRWKRY